MRSIMILLALASSAFAQSQQQIDAIQQKAWAMDAKAEADTGYMQANAAKEDAVDYQVLAESSKASCEMYEGYASHWYYIEGVEAYQSGMVSMADGEFDQTIAEVQHVLGIDQFAEAQAYYDQGEYAVASVTWYASRVKFNEATSHYTAATALFNNALSDMTESFNCFQVALSLLQMGGM